MFVQTLHCQKSRYIPERMCDLCKGITEQLKKVKLWQPGIGKHVFKIVTGVRFWLH